MKFKLYFTLLGILCSSVISFAQNNAPIERCSTPEYHKELINSDPLYKSRIDSIEKVMQAWIEEHKDNMPKTIVTIPVVFHIVYNTDIENVSNERIYEQLDALNRDYRNLNPDGVNVPAEFQQYRADTYLEFCLAKRDPNGNSTTGIERRHTNETSFPISLNSGVKYYSQGGLDAWNSSKYLNIWVCDLTGNNLGYAQFPGGNPDTDGLVVDYEYFGITATTPPFTMGRTSVHEIGHCFNLIHIWGDINDCSATDYCIDTPNQETYNFYCPSFPLTDACTTNPPGIMFMNYMDYVDDECMLMFTHDQAARIQACLNTIRAELKVSDGCVPIGIEELNGSNSLKVYPNPASDKISIEIPNITIDNISIAITNSMGSLVYAQSSSNFNSRLELRLPNLPQGIYFLKVESQSFCLSEKIFILNNKTP